MKKKQFSPTVSVAGREFLRIPIKTKNLTADDDIIEVIQEFTKEIIRDGDIIVISESPLAIIQGRAIPESEIKVGLLASILWRFVGKVNYGIGLRSPTSMQCAIEETGHLRILFAAFVSMLGKLIGRKGDFYRIAGMQAALIDAANTSPVPPYTKCVIKGPKEPNKVTALIKEKTGYEAVVMDINDIGGSWAIAKSQGVDAKLLEAVMKDNPQGQGDEMTPICLVRAVKR